MKQSKNRAPVINTWGFAWLKKSWMDFFSILLERGSISQKAGALNRPGCAAVPARGMSRGPDAQR